MRFYINVKLCRFMNFSSAIQVGSTNVFQISIKRRKKAFFSSISEVSRGKKYILVCGKDSTCIIFLKIESTKLLKLKLNYLKLFFTDHNNLI